MPTVTPDPVEPVPERDSALLFCGLPAADPETGVWDSTLLPNMMDTLTAHGMSAAFFLSEEQLLPAAETAREVCARGFTPGILITDGEDPLAQARRTADLYVQVLHTRIRPVCAPGLELTEAQKLALKAEGFLLWEADAAPYAEGMTIYRLNTTTRRLLDKAESDRTLLFTPNTVTADALPTICGYLTELHYTVRQVNDWTLPF